jgi:hypothetical protein
MWNSVMAPRYTFTIGMMYRNCKDPFQIVEVTTTDVKTALAWANSILKPNHMQILIVMGDPK